MNGRTQDLRIEDYDYPLPEERIAKYPLHQRDHSKLLCYDHGKVRETLFYDLPSLIPSGYLMVRNNTKVIRARLLFRKDTGAQIEIFCLEPHLPADYERNFSARDYCEWKCLVGNSKKWKEGEVNAWSSSGVKLSAVRVSNEGETSIIRFQWEGERTFSHVLEAFGELPIPPYLHRKTEESDLTTYQTVYSKVKGSVAAPTAGLHFTSEVLHNLEDNGVETEEVTLHVGAGTFKPVKSDTIGEHSMHSEVISVRRDTLVHIQQRLGKIIAVGTTSVRTLESLYYIGVKLRKREEIDERDLVVEQWEPYEDNEGKIEEAVSVYDALQAIIDYLDCHGLEALQTQTRILIAPGYKFHLVNRLITNFHQPKSTLMLLVSAYLNGDWKTVYDYALSHDFRFLSYGDSCYLNND